MKEIIDNGTYIIVEDCDIELLADDFDVKTEIEHDDITVVGCNIRNNGDEYILDIISYDLLFDEDEVDNISNEEKTKILSDIISSEEIDYNLLSSDIDKLKAENKTENLEDEELVYLQTSTSLGSSFCENDKFVYFYKYGAVNGTGTTYTYSSASSKSGYCKIGSLSFDIYAIKIKTSGTITYDNVYAICVASGLNDKYVTKFNTSLSVSENTQNSILDYTDPDGDSSTSTTGSVGTSVNSSGKVTASTTVSYSYNPNALSIVPVCGEKYVKTWKATAQSYVKNKSWKVKPAILLKKTNGTTSSVTATVYVDYFQLSGGVRTYTISSTASCKITFKNHKAV